MRTKPEDTFGAATTYSKRHLGEDTKKRRRDHKIKTTVRTHPKRVIWNRQTVREEGTSGGSPSGIHFERATRKDCTKKKKKKKTLSQWGDRGTTDGVMR